MIWANGKRYEGDWETCYTSRSSKQEFSTGGGNGGQVLNRSSVRKRNVNLPRTCIWESDGEVGDIICDIVDNREASSMFVPRNDDDGDEDDDDDDEESESSEGDESGDFRKSPCHSEVVEMKKPGQLITKGHKNYDLVLSLQLGIR